MVDDLMVVKKMNVLPDLLNNELVLKLIDAALTEDIGGDGDITTKALIPEKKIIAAEIISRSEYAISGTRIAETVFKKLDPEIKCDIRVADGETARAGAVVMCIRGKAIGILAAERTALNFMQRMCGIASLTRKFVEKVMPYNVAILDTRKTVPGHRALDKYAVLCGGGVNHRKCLSDMVLIKDNHRNLWRSSLSGDLGQAVQEARKKFPDVPIEVEVETEEDFQHAIGALPEWILLDNMNAECIRRCVRLSSGRCKLEASGGITLENIVEIAKTGVDAISLGCLTHSPPAADLSMEITLNG